MQPCMASAQLPPKYWGELTGGISASICTTCMHVDSTASQSYAVAGLHRTRFVPMIIASLAIRKSQTAMCDQWLFKQEPRHLLSFEVQEESMGACEATHHSICH